MLNFYRFLSLENWGITLLCFEPSDLCRVRGGGSVLCLGGDSGRGAKELTRNRLTMSKEKKRKKAKQRRIYWKNSLESNHERQSAKPEVLYSVASERERENPRRSSSELKE